jgi:branched-subunit amino acid ABC-type transport system permease component
VRSLLQFTLGGMATGFILVLIALGFVVVYRVSGIVNLAQGELLVLGALTAVALSQDRGWPVWIAIVAAILLSSAAGAGLDVILQRSRSNDHVALIVMTLGASILGSEILREIFGPDPRLMRSFLSTKPIRIFGASVLPHQILVWVVAAGALLGFALFFGRTITGRALEACSQSPEGAALVGISVKRMRLLAFSIGGFASGIAGVLLATLAPVNFSSGLVYGAKGLVVAILANWSYRNIVWAGLLIALSEAYAVGYVSSEYKDIVSMVVLIVVILWRAVGMTVGDRWRLSRSNRLEFVTSDLTQNLTLSESAPETSARAT